jgi:hypothetical protein
MEMADTEHSAASPARPTLLARNATGLVREIRLRGPDAVAVAYRRLLAELGADAVAGPAEAPSARHR